MASPGEGGTVFTFPYLSAGAPALGEVKGLIKNFLYIIKFYFINSLASPSAGAPALKYGDVNTVTPSPGEVKG